MHHKIQTRNMIILVAAVIVACALGAYALWLRSPEAPVPAASQEGSQAQPQLDKETALALLKDGGARGCQPGGVEGSYASCTVGITETSGAWFVTVTRNGLYDDSVEASRTEAVVVRRDGEWMVDATAKTQRCAAGRGHQDFSTEPCI